MEFNALMSGYSEMWEENREWRQARDRLAEMARRANIVVYHSYGPGNRSSSEYGTHMLKNMTSVMGLRTNADVTRMFNRYWQWATTYPGARSQRPEFWDTIDPATGWGVGYPKEPLARQYDSRTGQWYELPGPWLPLPAMAGVTEDIQAKIDSHKQEANALRKAINDWLYQHGINGAVMDEQELSDHIDYVNEIERGNPIMQMMVEAAAPQASIPYGSFEPPTEPTPEPFFSLRNFDISKTWPGIAAGAAAALLL